MRDVLRGTLVGLVVIALLGAVASRAGWIETNLPRPSGQGAWHLSRATGLAAFIALSLDVIAGLLVSTRAADRWIPRKETVDLHGWLSPLALTLVAFHAIVLVADGYIRFDAIDILVPFASSYRPVAVGIGVLAAYLAVAVHVSFGLRKKIGPKVWRKLHYLSFAVFTASAVHAIVAGSDAARPAFVAIYATPVVIVAGLLALRFRRAVA